MKDAEIKRITKNGTIIPMATETGKRWEWLASMINKEGYKFGAEIGAHSGVTTGHLLRLCPKIKELYAVDLWAKPPKGCSDQYDNWNFIRARGRFNEAVKGFPAVKVLKKVSWEAANSVLDCTLDFIFIDADHEYGSVKKDIAAWTPKLKDGGMISGHDTHFPSVVKAIDELIPGWKSAGIDHVWYAKKEDVVIPETDRQIQLDIVARMTSAKKDISPTEPGKRFDWLSSVIKKRNYKVGVEVGCAGGKTTGIVLKRCSSLKLFVVDIWAPVPDEVGGGTQYKEWDYNKIKRIFNKNTRLFKDRLTILQGVSWDMADKVKDNSLDFVFIDADHEYESVKKDILAWTPKLKEGGMLSGHDTHFDGVYEAINELIPTWSATGIDHVWECRKEDVLC